MSSLNPVFSPRRRKSFAALLKIHAPELALIFRPCICVMAKRLRDVCTYRKANRSGTPDAASSSAIGVAASRQSAAV